MEKKVKGLIVQEKVTVLGRVIHSFIRTGFGQSGYILHLKLASKSLPEMHLPTALLRLLGAGETVITGEATGALKSASLPVVSRLDSQIPRLGPRRTVRSFGSKSEIPFSRNAHLSSCQPDHKHAHRMFTPLRLSSLNQCEHL